MSITYCLGTECPLKFSCKRFLELDSSGDGPYLILKFEKLPYNPSTSSCACYWENTGE